MSYATEQTTPQAGRLPVRTPLSRRQNEILHLRAAGLTNQRIARRLGISTKTVEKHVELGRVRFGRWLYEHGLIAYEAAPPVPTLLYTLGRLEAQQEVA